MVKYNSSWCGAEIGIQSGLKNLWWQHREGSTPSRTTWAQKGSKELISSGIQI